MCQESSCIESVVFVSHRPRLCGSAEVLEGSLWQGVLSELVLTD